MRKLLILIITIMTLGVTASLQDVNYSFDDQKNQAATDTFHFLRSYVDYFYLILKQNPSDLKAITSLSKTSGFCVGDAHAENFGMILQQNGTSLFTMNDMDDFGPCPVAFDMFRLIVSSKIYDPTISIDKILKNYISGLNIEKKAPPKVLQKLLFSSLKKGFEVNPKKIGQNKFIRDAQMQAVDTATAAEIKTELSKKVKNLSNNFQIIDLVLTRKIGGGSGGLLRYEILIQDLNKLLHLELKEETIPSIYPVATDKIPDTTNRIQSALNTEQGPAASGYYAVVNIGQRQMLVRPRFHGNIGITLNDFSAIETEDVIKYEAYILGQIHARTIKNVKSYLDQIQNVKISDLNQDATMMSAFFDKKFMSLKKN